MEENDDIYVSPIVIKPSTAEEEIKREGLYPNRCVIGWIFCSVNIYNDCFYNYNIYIYNLSVT